MRSKVVVTTAEPPNNSAWSLAARRARNCCHDGARRLDCRPYGWAWAECYDSSAQGSRDSLGLQAGAAAPGSVWPGAQGSEC